MDSYKAITIPNEGISLYFMINGVILTPIGIFLIEAKDTRELASNGFPHEVGSKMWFVWIMLLASQGIHALGIMKDIYLLNS